MGAKTLWVPVGELWPEPYRMVLVATDKFPDSTSAVNVGYMKFAAGDGDCPYFVCPGARRGFKALYWRDCLGDDFTTPLWQMTQPASSAPPSRRKPIDAPSVAEGEDKLWDREPDPCWSCGGKAEARDDIHVRCIDSKGVNCEVMGHWFTRKTWNTRATPSPVDHEKQAREIAWSFATLAFIDNEDAVRRELAHRITTALRAAAGVDRGASLLCEACCEPIGNQPSYSVHEACAAATNNPEDDVEIRSPSEAAQRAAKALWSELYTYLTANDDLNPWRKEFYEADALKIITRYCGTGEMK